MRSSVSAKGTNAALGFFGAQKVIDAFVDTRGGVELAVTVKVEKYRLRNNHGRTHAVRWQVRICPQPAREAATRLVG
jgi:hypothetical protein